jgi:hypothetical protein
MAEDADDFEAESDVVERLREIGVRTGHGRSARLRRQAQRPGSRSKRRRRR